MGDTTGYYPFGGGTEDYVRETGTANLLVNTALTVTDLNGVVLTDLLDDSTDATSSVSSDANGEYNFWATEPVLRIQAAGSNIYTIISRTIVESAAAAGAGITIDGHPGPQFSTDQLGILTEESSINAGQVSGLASVATSGNFTDLDDVPAFAPLGDDGKVPASYISAGSGGGGAGFWFQNPDGTYGSRLAITSDPTIQLTLVPAYDPTTRPPAASFTDLSLPQRPNPTASPKIPGDRLENSGS